MAELALVVIMTMVVLALAAPRAAVLLYAATASYGDGFGVSRFLARDLPGFPTAMAAVFGVLVATACLRSFGSAGGRDRGEVRLVRAGAIVCLLVPIGSLLKGASIVSSFSHLGELGVPALLVWVVSGWKGANGGWGLYSIYVVAQMSIATAVLLLPSLSPISGESYLRYLGIDGEASATVNLRLATDSADKLDLDRFAQFHNPNALGFYATMAMVVGLILWVTATARRGATSRRALGIVVVMCGALGWLNSQTRGPALGLILAVLAVLVVLGGYRSSTSNRANLRPLIAVGVVLLAGFVATGALTFLLPGAGDLSVAGRVESIRAGVAAISAAPMLGVPPGYDWYQGRPHALPIWLSALHGLPLGLLATSVFVGAGVLAYRYARDRDARTADEGEWRICHRAVVVTLVLPVAGIAVTNNFASPILFATSLGVALTYAAPRPYLQGASGRPALISEGRI